jgi:mono/diheme cytochrome c family protein
MSEEIIARRATLLKACGRVRQAVAMCLFVFPLLSCADDPKPAITLSDGPTFAERDGEGLYRGICQACHMSKGEGASGAGHYPALADNPRLESAVYPVYTVLHGRDGMPGFAHYLSDEQVAAVVNYTRTHFGNAYQDRVSADDVRKLR